MPQYLKFKVIDKKTKRIVAQIVLDNNSHFVFNEEEDELVYIPVKEG